MTEPYGYDDDTTDDGDDEGQDQRYVRLPREQIRSMEKKSKAYEKAQQELESMRREITLSKLGADLTERQQKALFASIDGDITAESVREAAVDLGFVQPPANTPQGDEAAALTRMSQASAGAQDPGSEDPVARLERADREGGREAVLAEIQRSGLARIQQ